MAYSEPLESSLLIKSFEGRAVKKKVYCIYLKNFMSRLKIACTVSVELGLSGRVKSKEANSLVVLYIPG